MNAIEFKNVSVNYKLRHEKYFTLKELVVNLFKKEKYIYENFAALNNISFNIKKGETCGIIGENGSGKSTILKLIAGVFDPTQGIVITDGKISALIELGAGFNLELTGTENVFLNGAILGFSKKEMKEKFKRIVEFAEIEHFIDIPVKYYSSGMYMRLAFSIAIEVNPEILLIDEILAVGDEAFQKKCFNRIYQFKKKEKTIIFVSHDMEAIRKLCDRVLVLHQGKIIEQGIPEYAIEKYHRSLYGKEIKNIIKPSYRVLTSSEIDPNKRWGSFEIEIQGVAFLNQNRVECNEFRTKENLIVHIKYFSHKKIENPVFGLAIFRKEDNTWIIGPNTKFSNFSIDFVEGEGVVEYIIESVPLLPGEYQFSAVVYDYDCKYAYDHQDKMYQFRIIEGGTKEKYGILEIQGQWRHWKN